MYVYVKAMSVTQGQLKTDLGHYGDLIAIHIAKILLYPQSPSVNHWITEIHAFLFDVPKLKMNNKRPTSEFISTYLIDHSGDRGDTFRRIAIREENDSNYSDKISSNSIDSACSDYFQWLGRCLSESEITLEQVFDKMHEIMIKYGG